MSLRSNDRREFDWVHVTPATLVRFWYTLYTYQDSCRQLHKPEWDSFIKKANDFFSKRVGVNAEVRSLNRGSL